MNPIRRPFGLAAAVLCAVSSLIVAVACAPINNADASGVDRRGSSGGDPTTTSNENGNNAEAGAPTKTGLPCSMAGVLEKNCQTCHGREPKSGASTSLVTWDDLQKDDDGKKLYEVVKERIHAEAGRMPPAARLADAEIKSIDDWIAGGAKQVDDTCGAGNGPPPPTRPFVCDAPATTVVMKAAKPFTWTADIAKPDQYMCFGVDVAVAAKRHIIALGPKIENLNIVHHVLLFQAKDAMSSEPQPCTTDMTGTWKLVTGWAPGGGNLELPPEAGYPEEGTTHWILQVHYNNASGKHVGETDNSGYQLCSTDQLRPNDAGTLAFGSHDFTIPPRTSKYTLKCDYKLGSRYKGVRFFTGSPHMHTLGLAISTERLAGGTGAPEMIFEQSPFSFENQDDFKIDKRVEPGDIMRTRCVWKNPSDKAVTWGEGTGDEMCFNFLAYYPAIPDFVVGPVPIQSWVSPSLALPGIGVDCAEEK